MSHRFHQWLHLGRNQAEHFYWLATNRRQSLLSKRQRKPLSLAALERRLLMSATPIDPTLLAGQSPSDSAATEIAVALESDREAANELTKSTFNSVATDVGQVGTTIVFVDANVSDLEYLLADVAQHTPDAEVFVLDSDKDGIETISEVLKSRSDVAAIHLVTHAEGDSVRLGNVLLNSKTIQGFAGQIANWGTSLASDADMIFYGCDLASTSSGQELIESIAALTGADIAASDDDTGLAAYGGDWEFEFVVGKVESDAIVSDSFQDTWRAKLSTITVTTTDDTINGFDGVISLREAILMAGDGDTIVLQAERYDLTRVGWGLFLGDLDITRDVTIIGAGADQTIIRGEMGHRIFDIQDSSNVSISGLTIEKGVAQLGGGIRIRAGSSLELSQVIIEDSDATVAGGGIYSEGRLTIIDSRIVGNRSDGNGAGVYSNGLLDIVRSSLESNRSATRGGGVYIAGGTANLTAVTISGNEASD
ncbi:MAG: DUF4347 domain-containing protein, partial [Planctomycetales bacterium]|nr:DUF4347 domain-containing protein [Planctomycetales bacterium]